MTDDGKRRSEGEKQKLTKGMKARDGLAFAGLWRGAVGSGLFDGKERCGLIVYELKRTRAIQVDHVKQAAEAKRIRSADMAILVTTGSKRGFNGFSTVDGTPVVAPQGVIALVSIVREHLIQMRRANLSKEQQQVVAQKVIEFLTGAHFKNHMEGIIQVATELQRILKAEAKSHFKNWGERWQRYQNVSWDADQIKANLALVLQGKEARLLRPPRFPAPLLLPEI